jgi:hypothetical protein
MSAHSEWLDQFKEGNAAGGHATEVEAISYSAVPPAPMTLKIDGGYVVRDTDGQSLAYIYSRDNEDEARQAKVLTKDEARRIAISVAWPPELLGKGEQEW